MEVKKSKKADLEGQRTTALLIGLIIALAAMFLAFEWTTHEYKDNSPMVKFASVLTDEADIIPITQPIFATTPPPPVEAPQVADILDIVDNDTDVEETKIETTEDTNIAVPGPSSPHSGPVVGPPAPTMDSGETDEVFEIVQENPSFPGGDQALMTWLQKNLRYPVSAQEAGIQGRVLVSFVVNKDGSIVEPKIVRSVDAALDKESCRVVTAMPRWKPGKQHGKNVRVKYTLPVTFRLQ